MQENAFSVIIQSRIVKSLAFKGMYSRFNIVDKTYFKTFRWILHNDDVSGNDGSNPEDDTEGVADEDDATQHGITNKASNAPPPGESKDAIAKQQDEIKRVARAKFTNWLSSGEGVFHISGKLGSGKSTLMKYLGDHPRTLANLRE